MCATTTPGSVSLWRFDKLSAYQPPSEPATERAKRGFSFLLSLFAKRESLRPFADAEDALDTLTEEKLDRVAPEPDWSEAADAWHVILHDWLRDPASEHPVVALVGPPYGGHAQILSCWAQSQGWRSISPPTPEQILATDADWLASQFRQDDPWILPNLERTYLRHANGLGLVRAFLEQAYAGTLGRGVIG